MLIGKDSQHMASVSDDTAREIASSPPTSKLVQVLSSVIPGHRVRFAVQGERKVIGRAPECEVRLDFADVSRRHAELFHEGSALILRDLGSTNGIQLDGQRVRNATLTDGSVVRIGSWLGIMERLQIAEMDEWCRERVPGLLGGPIVQRALNQLSAVAPTELPIMLIGATGTGKERFAAAAHRFSGRLGPLHPVNCAALPTTLAESELFGHERGAFTGADSRTRGHFRAADGGTLFLDEIQELSMSLQAKVLRAVELRQVTPLGDSRAFGFDARLVVASQTPLRQLVEAGSFREDLAMRLDGLTIKLAPLTQRRGDIPTLFDYFLREHSSGAVPSVPASVYERLCLYGWPGNVRELELLARRLLALHADRPLSVADLPEQFDLSRPTSSGELAFQSRDDEDRHALNTALQQTGGNVKRAAELARLSRSRAYRLLGRRSASNEN